VGGGGVDWPLCVPPTVERDRRAWKRTKRHQSVLTIALKL